MIPEEEIKSLKSFFPYGITPIEILGHILILVNFSIARNSHEQPKRITNGSFEAQVDFVFGSLNLDSSTNETLRLLVTSLEK